MYNQSNDKLWPKTIYLYLNCDIVKLIRTTLVINVKKNKNNVIKYQIEKKQRYIIPLALVGKINARQKCDNSSNYCPIIKNSYHTTPFILNTAVSHF